MQKKKLISINLSLGSWKDFLDVIIDFSEKRISSYVCVANVHMLVEAYDSKIFREVVNNAIIVTPDGVPLVWGVRFLYGIRQERIAGMDLMPKLLGVAEERGLSVFFYGSTEEILLKIKARVTKELTKLKIAGMYSPPFRVLEDREKQEVIDMINSSDANIVLVSLGCPKQEKWMFEMKGKINAVMIGLGAAFPVYAGALKRAPLWMQRFGLEWLYRLFQDPNRLWKRYFYTNVKFIYLLVREKLLCLRNKK